jgi:hypothetical protein
MKITQGNTVVYEWPDNKPRTIAWFVDAVKRRAKTQPDTPIRFDIIPEEIEKVQKACKRLGWRSLWLQGHIDQTCKREGVWRFAFIPPKYQRAPVDESYRDLFTPKQIQSALDYTAWVADKPKRGRSIGGKATKDKGKEASNESIKVYEQLRKKGWSDHPAIVNEIYRQINKNTPSEYEASRAEDKPRKQTRSIRSIRDDVKDMKQ